MAFPRRLLTEGEELVIDARPHWIALVGPVLVAILVVALMSGGLLSIHGGGSGKGILRWLLTGVAIVLLVIYPVRRFIQWITSHFVVTSQRVIHRQGWIAKSSMEVPLQRINDVRFHQTVLERAVGAGDLIIESAGTRGQEIFSDIRHPEEMQRTIYELAQRREAGIGGATPPAPAASGSSTATSEELSRLADLRDRGVLTEEEFQAQKARLLGSS